MSSPRIVRCPTCQGPSPFTPENRWRPFCSERCREMDLGAWASEQFSLPAAPPQDGDDEPPAVRPGGSVQ